MNNKEALMSSMRYLDTYESTAKKGIFSNFCRIFTNIFKRIFDIIISLIGLIFLIPITIIVKIMYLVEGDKDTIFFKQKRTGKNGKEFNLLKFRSMKINNDVRKFEEENEYTKTGKLIRKFSLDEIPQLFNILRGEMSFIGPRPWIPEYYENMNDIQRKRVSVLPGITGLAQVNGRNGITVIEKINYDLEYVKNYSILLDIVIVFKTIITVLKKQHADISKFGIKEEIDELKKQNKKDNIKQQASSKK